MLRRLSRFALVLGVLFLGPALAATAQVDGRYEAISEVPGKNSRDVVRVEEFLNFTCPHCNNFRDAAKPLHDKYGQRLEWEYIPVLFRGQSDYALRLFFIAQREGRGAEVKDMIFDATFRYSVNINDPAVISYLARSAGMAEAYKGQRDAEWVTRKVQRAQQRAQEAGVRATPTVVVEGALRTTPQSGMDTFVNNLDRIIGQLLRGQS